MQTSLRPARRPPRYSLLQSILNDPGIYPDEQTMSRLFTNTAYNEQAPRTATRLWTRIKTGR